MKIAYRIITPILALGAIAMGLLLKLFYFAIGGLSEEITSIVTIAQQFGLQTEFEYSAIEIIQMLLGVQPAEEGSADLLTIAEPILPHLVTFIVFFVLALILLLVVAVVSAATNKRKTVIGLCAGGLVICFICIVVSRLAFDIIMSGDAIKLTDLVGAFSENAWAQIAAAVVKVSTAILSAGFYAVFGMYILIILWTVLTNMLIKTPIQFEKKHRRKKPLRRPSAIFNR